MTRFGYAPGAYDLFHVGHLNLLREAKCRCEYLIAGVVSDEILRLNKGITPVVPLSERLEIVGNIRFVDVAVAEDTPHKIQMWNSLRFDTIFKGDDWKDTDKGRRLVRDFAAVGVDVVFLPRLDSTSSTKLRGALKNIDTIARRVGPTPRVLVETRDLASA
ncbi:MAG: cytidyltransferase [Ramlibacter sp.]|nr:cytidyltransferase [Ramlibacter sp.]